MFKRNLGCVWINPAIPLRRRGRVTRVQIRPTHERDVRGQLVTLLHISGQISRRTGHNKVQILMLLDSLIPQAHPLLRLGWRQINRVFRVPHT